MCMCACAQNAERESGTKLRIGHMTITHYVIQCSLKKPRNPSKEARLSFRAGARESLGSRLVAAVPLRGGLARASRKHTTSQPAGSAQHAPLSINCG